MGNTLTQPERKVVYLNVEDVLPNRFQPRIKFDEQALQELSDSIKEHGVLSPITVRPLGNKFEIIAGERRYKASTMCGLKEIPALVVDMDDKESAEIALIENVQRKDLTPIEEAISYKKIFDMNIGISQDTLAKKLGKSQSSIANKLRLLNLSDEVQEALLENKISERHARSLLKIKDKKTQNKLLERIIKERLTVRKTDEVIINMLNNKDVEILDFNFENEPIKKEEIISPIDRFENLYNLPKSNIIEDKEDEFIPSIPEVSNLENNVKKIEPINNVSINETDLDKTIDLSQLKQDIGNIDLNIPNSSKENKVSLEEILKTPISEDIKITNINLDNTIDLSQAKPQIDINPGFMDISKIENEAKDINENLNKVSLEELLNSNNKKVEQTNESSNTNNSLGEFLKTTESSKKEDLEIPKATIPQGRFFTMFDEDNDNNSNDNIFKSLESSNTELENSFNEQIKEENDTNNNAFNFDLNSILNSNTESSNENSFDLNSIVNENNESSDLKINTISENTNNHSIFNEDLFAKPIALNNEEVGSDIKLGIDDESIDNFDFNSINFTPTIESNFELPKSDIIEEESEETFNAPSNYEFNIENFTSESKLPPLDDFELPKENIEYKPIYEEIESEKVDNSKYGAADLKTIINTIRKCAETIEKYGYVIDTEEFDFEDMYQVIFKVQKKQ